jgi:hypothetical protein
MAIKTFTTGEVLTAADTNTYLANAGLDYIGAVTLNAVTNNVSNVFSSTYQSYRVVISGLSNATTTTRPIYLRLRTTTDDLTAQYNWNVHFVYATGTANTSGQNAVNAADIGSVSQAGGGVITFDIVNPNLATITSWVSLAYTYQSNVGAFVMRTQAGAMNTTTQYTGFSIIGTTDALSGTVRTYGYRQA